MRKVITISKQIGFASQIQINQLPVVITIHFQAEILENRKIKNTFSNEDMVSWWIIVMIRNQLFISIDITFWKVLIKLKCSSTLS
jgi:hypothetical protein